MTGESQIQSPDSDHAPSRRGHMVALVENMLVQESMPPHLGRIACFADDLTAIEKTHV